MRPCRPKHKPAANTNSPTKTRNGLVDGSDGSSDGGQVTIKPAAANPTPTAIRTIRRHASRRRKLA
jgi:hypothetical protein